MKKPPIIVWIRTDLRLADHPALSRAVEQDRPVVPVYIWAPDEEGPWAPGGASRWWLRQSLGVLDEQLRTVGSRLIVRRGPSLESLQALARETGASAVYWSRRYEPAVIARDAKIKEALRGSGFEAESFNAGLLHEPWTVQNKSGKPFQVFTPFWRCCLAKPDPGLPLPRPRSIPSPARWPASEPLDALGLEPVIDWASGIRGAWTPGETGARVQLEAFLKSAVHRYSEDRNRPDFRGTSRLSPFLHFGEISPREVWHAVREALAAAAPAAAPRSGAFERTQGGGDTSLAWRSSQYLAELGWREFAHHLLYHFPGTPEEPLRGEYRAFPWRKDARLLKAWQKGLTGYPIVDAGMRELWTTGWMHNRVRMIVASFLVKDLLLPWQQGAAWFWDTLVDADLAQNTMGWQWSAGCGADAAPFFRVFNPSSQGQKFDPEGRYVRRWCPELARLPDKWLHSPWEAPGSVVEDAGIAWGRTYPRPIVSHSAARIGALEAFSRFRRPSGP